MSRCQHDMMVCSKLCSESSGIAPGGGITPTMTRTYKVLKPDSRCILGALVAHPTLEGDTWNRLGSPTTSTHAPNPVPPLQIKPSHYGRQESVVFKDANYTIINHTVQVRRVAGDRFRPREGARRRGGCAFSSTRVGGGNCRK